MESRATVVTPCELVLCELSVNGWYTSQMFKIVGIPVHPQIPQLDPIVLHF